MIDQNVADSELLLCIFFALFAREAEARMGQRIEAIEVDLLAAAVALAERLRRAIEPAQRFVDVPEKRPSELANRNAFSRSIASVP